MPAGIAPYRTSGTGVHHDVRVATVSLVVLRHDPLIRNIRLRVSLGRATLRWPPARADVRLARHPAGAPTRKSFVQFGAPEPAGRTSAPD